MNSLRPFFSYFGGKWSLTRHYPEPVAGLPIIEPFAGSAGYATRFADREVVLVEKAPHLAAIWRWLISVSVDEVMGLPLDVDQCAGLQPAARDFVYLWTSRCGVRVVNPIRSNWRLSGKWPSSYWGEAIRKRVADQVPSLRHWTIIEGDYSDAPDCKATWFVDPPYINIGRNYLARVDDYVHLGAWCRSRRGSVIVCEAEGASWLPFQSLTRAKSCARTSYTEVVWLKGTRPAQNELFSKRGAA